MTKSDLRTGMIVTYRNGIKGVVYLDIATGNSFNQNNIIITKDGTWLNFLAFNDDLTHKTDNSFDIIKSEVLTVTSNFINPLIEKIPTTILWERPESAKKITISEIEAILGYKVEIINEN